FAMPACVPPAPMRPSIRFDLQCSIAPCVVGAGRRLSALAFLASTGERGVQARVAQSLACASCADVAGIYGNVVAYLASRACAPRERLEFCFPWAGTMQTRIRKISRTLAAKKEGALRRPFPVASWPGDQNTDTASHAAATAFCS